MTESRKREARRAVAERLGRNWAEWNRREEEAEEHRKPAKVAASLALSVSAGLIAGATGRYFGMEKLPVLGLSAVIVLLPQAGALFRTIATKHRARRTRVLYEASNRKSGRGIVGTGL